MSVAGTWLAALRRRAPRRRAITRATIWTASVTAAIGGLIVGVAYVNAIVHEAQVGPGPWPRLEMLAALIHPRMLAAIGLAAVGALGALFVGVSRSMPGATDG